MAFEDNNFENNDIEQGGSTVSVQQKLGKSLEVVVTFKKICYVVPLPTGKEKKILDDVSGAVHPGEMLALMGPSGSGKTTLLNFLGGRMRSGVTGRIAYNGATFTKPMKRKIGFVSQDDIVLQNLTVHETLVCTALLRLPNTLSRNEKIQRANEVILELGLERCKDTLLGGTFRRGVSGGERKRVCIGQEMLINPSILLLDEPTSGLDSTTALRIVALLRTLAKSGKCIISTIHQPSSPAFATFDKLLLLCEGSPIYFGRANGAMDYFGGLDFHPKFATNPADYLLDLATGVTHETLPGVGFTEEGKVVGNTPVDGTVARETYLKESEKQQEIKDTLKVAYREHWATSDNGLMSNNETEDEAKAPVLKKEWPTSWLEQFIVLLVRGVKSRRGEALEMHRALQVAAVSIIVGLLWWRMKLTDARSVQDMTGLLFFTTNFWGFFPIIGAVVTFPNERKILSKERAAGMYRLSTYFMARIITDLPIVLLLPTVSMGVVVYWMTGLRLTFAAFFLTLLCLLTNVLVAQGLGQAIGAALMDAKSATTLSAVMMLTFLLAGGFFVQSIPVFISWLRYISFPYYVFHLLVKVQFPPGTTYPCGTTENPGALCLVEDSEALDNITLGGGGFEAGILILMFFSYRFFAYMFLRRVKPLR